MDLTSGLSCFKNPKDDCDKLASVGYAAQEMQLIYQETLPYILNEEVGGFCLVWEESFIALCRYAMSTDCMDAMSSAEREIWRYLVRFEDAHSPSANTDHCLGSAVGSTNYFEEDLGGTVARPVGYDSRTIGFCAVPSSGDLTEPWIIKLTPPSITIPYVCTDEISDAPVYDVPKNYVYDDLDNIFRLINLCQPYNDCGCDEDVELEFPHVCPTGLEFV